MQRNSRCLRRMCQGCVCPPRPASTPSDKVTARLRHARQAGHSPCRGRASSSSGISTSAFTNSEPPLTRLRRHLCASVEVRWPCSVRAAQRRRRSSVGSQRQRQSGRRRMTRSRPSRRRRVDVIGCDAGQDVQSSLCPRRATCVYGCRRKSSLPG